MFRNKYLDYAELTAQLRAWQTDHPGVVRVTSLGKSAEGRDIPVATIGRDPDSHRPAIWVDANMHATELCGSSVALAIAEDVIRIHAKENVDLPVHMQEILRQSLFYIVPRMSPDGAEHVLTSGRY